MTAASDPEIRKWTYEDVAECNAMMGAGALAAIQELLDASGIPRGTFADDQVRNLVALYNQRGALLVQLTASAAAIREDIHHLFTEIDCRIEHGANSRGHLEYVHTKHKAFCQGRRPGSPVSDLWKDIHGQPARRTAADVEPTQI